MDSTGSALTGPTWTNLTGRTGGTIAISTSWEARPVPLVPDKTNIIVVMATMPATWTPGQVATTTFSDTLFIFSTPVRLSLTPQGHDLLLDWSGGVPPFSVATHPNA
jgi:hypothetical protein